MKRPKRKIFWSTGASDRATLFWHNGGPLPGELQTNRSRGVWIECLGNSTWLARSWQGAYDEMKRMGFHPIPDPAYHDNVVHLESPDQLVGAIVEFIEKEMG